MITTCRWRSGRDDKIGLVIHIVTNRKVLKGGMRASMGVRKKRIRARDIGRLTSSGVY